MLNELNNLWDRYGVPALQRGDIKPLKIIIDWLNDLLKQINPGIQFVLETPWLKWPLIIGGTVLSVAISGAAATFLGASIKIAAVLGGLVGVVAFLTELFVAEVFIGNRERENLEQQLRAAHNNYTAAQTVNANMQPVIDQLRQRNQQLNTNNTTLQNELHDEQVAHQRVRTERDNLQAENVGVRERVRAYEARCDEYGVPHDDLREATTSTRPRTGA